MREAHRNNFAAMDEWCELTIEDIRRIEQQDIAEMKKVRGRGVNQRGREKRGQDGGAGKAAINYWLWNHCCWRGKDVGERQ